MSPDDHHHQKLLQREERRVSPVNGEDEPIVGTESSHQIARHLTPDDMIDEQRRRRETQQQLDPIRPAHRQRMARRQRGKPEPDVNNRRRQQQRLAEAGLPRHQQHAPPSFHRIDRHQAQGEVTEMPGDEEQQDDAADQADAPYDQPRKQHSVSDLCGHASLIETFTPARRQSFFAR